MMKSNDDYQDNNDVFRLFVQDDCCNDNNEVVCKCVSVICI